MIKRITLAFCLLAAVSLSVRAQAPMNASMANSGTTGEPRKLVEGL